jgi:ubiquinone/menaquinone biosynthesis C-methylase UbiE
MQHSNKLGEKLSGRNKEEMPNIAFHIMTTIMKLVDLLGNRSSKNFKTLNLKKGQTVIDYGCGPARYIRNASSCVGEEGKVIAVDIHPLAIKKVKLKIEKFKLTNVKAVLANGYNTPIAKETADVIYALDVFHMIEHPKKFLTELSRLLKQEGKIIIEDGHQPRSETIKKIKKSDVLTIIQETEFHVECKKKDS